MTRLQLLAGEMMGSFLFITTSSEAHPAFYPVGTGSSYPRGKVARA